jgi:hypothetical protein
VLRDLARLVPPDVWSIDKFGFLSFKPPARPTGASLLLESVVKPPGLVTIAGSEGAARLVISGQASELRDVAGSTFFDPAGQGPEANVAIFYDTTDNYAAGYWVNGLDGSRIDFPPHIVLGHELAHARQILEGAYTTRADGEAYAITVENDLRGADTPVLPFRQGHDGGRKDPPKKAPVENPPRSRDGCFVATAAYGSPLHPAVAELRTLRDHALRPTREGRAFFDRFYDTYAAASAPVVDAMRADEEVRELVQRCIVAPLVRYLVLARDLPDLPLEAAGPWAPFIEQVRAGVEELAAVVPLPSGLHDIPPERAANELLVALRYQLRTPERRRAWLLELRSAGDLPLTVTAAEAREMADALRAAGRSDEELDLILGTRRRRSVALSGFGNDLGSQADAVSWRYTVTLRNATPNETYLNLRVYYLAQPGDMNSMGLVTLDDLKPGEIAVFPLCECSRLQSYYIEGDLITTAGDTGQFVYPDEGSMTPGRAGDPNPCEDSWAF